MSCRVSVEPCRGDELDVCPARGLADLILQDLGMSAEGGPEYVRVDADAAVVEERVIETALRVLDASQGGAAGTACFGLA